MLDEEEEWKAVVRLGVDVSSLGRVRNSKTGRVLSQSSNGTGYGYLRLHSPATGKKEYVARAVCEGFLGKAKAGQEADHRDKDTSNNRIGNLRWLSKDANLTNRAIARGEQHSNARLTDSDVRRLRHGDLAEVSFTRAGKALGVSRQTVRDARSGKLWSHVQ